MAYEWNGMRVLKTNEIGDLFIKNGLEGYYRLYPDGSEAKIIAISFEEIVRHLENGGLFGEASPTKELMLPDGKKIFAPEIVDVSSLGFLNEIEYSLWGTIEEYLKLFGISMLDNTPDWATVKTVQESLLRLLLEAGVKFKFMSDEEAELREELGIRGIYNIKTEMEIIVRDEDIDDIMCGALEGGIAYWCDKVEVLGEYLGECASEQISRNGVLKFHDAEEDKIYELTKEKLLRGISLWAKNPVGCNCLEQINGRLEIDCCNADAEVCDAFIQYALFGDVIYA